MSATERCTISRRSVVQRWPAVPAAENTMPRTASSRSADGVTIAALLPPSSSRTRPNRCATRGPTCCPIRTEPGRAQQRHPWVVDQPFADLAAAQNQPAHRARRADVVGGPLGQRLAGQRGQRRQLRRLPHHGVAADQRDRGIPRPHRDREVERGDDADDAERMPGLHQPVPRPFGGDRPAVQLPRQPDGELADVDHLLHLAEGLRGDLAGLDGDQRGQIVLVLDEQFAEPGHQRAAHRSRCRAPRGKSLRRFGNGRVGLLRCGLCGGEQHVPGDGGAGGQPVGAGLTEFGARADGVQRVAGQGTQVLGRRKL